MLGTGDVWLSVWNTVVKTGLKNLQKDSSQKKLTKYFTFSGGTSNRPHLADFGKSIIEAGMVSNFDLIETKSAKVCFLNLIKTPKII